MRKKIFTSHVNFKLQDNKNKQLENICDDLNINKAEFIRTALEKEMSKYLVETK